MTEIPLSEEILDGLKEWQQLRMIASAAASDLYKKAWEREDKSWGEISRAHPEIERDDGWNVNIAKGVAYKP